MPHKDLMNPIDLIRSHANGLGMVGVALLAVSEAVGHVGFASDILQVVAAALTSAGIAVSAALYVFNLILSNKLNQYERINIAPFYERSDSADQRYDMLIENLKELKAGHNMIIKKIDENERARLR